MNNLSKHEAKQRDILHDESPEMKSWERRAPKCPVCHCMLIVGRNGVVFAEPVCPEHGPVKL